MGIIVRQSFKASIISYIGAIIGFVNILFVSPFCLSPEIIGLNRLITDSSLFLVFFVQLAVPNVAIRFFPYFKDEKNNHNGFFLILLVLPLIGFLIFGLIYLLLKEQIINYFIDNSTIFTSYFYYIIPLTFFLVYLNIFEAFSSCLLRIVVPKFIREIIVKSLNICIIILYYFKYLSLTQFIIALIAMWGIAVLLNVIYLVKFMNIKFNFSFKNIDKSIFRQIAIFSLFIIIGGIGSTIAGKIDVFMISSKVNIQATGIFTIASYMISVISIPSVALMQISAPIVAEALKQNNIMQINMIYKKSSINQFIIGLLLFITIWINIDNIFNIMPNGNIYLSGKYVILFLGIGKLFDMVTGVNTLIISNSKWYYFNFFFILSLAFFSVIGNSIFIPLYGIKGSAFATMLSLSLYNLMLLIFLRITMKIQPFTINTIKMLFILALVLLINFFIIHFKNAYIDILIRTIIILSIFVLLIYKMKVSEDINQFIKQVLNKNILKELNVKTPKFFKKHNKK